MVKRAAPSRLVDIRATDGGLGGAVRGDDASDTGSVARTLDGPVGLTDIAAGRYAEAYADLVNDPVALYNAHRKYGYPCSDDDRNCDALARAAADALPDCDCFPDV